MKVSVITPTGDRPQALQGIYRLLQQQSYPEWEWLVYDTSLHPASFSDSRVVYRHDDQIVSIGEKRNRLVEAARGDIIVHFDDDDYYAPSYLASTVSHLRESALCTLHAWFSYDTKINQFFYWDTEEEGDFRYIVHPVTGTLLREIEFGAAMQADKKRLNEKGKKGYGFSFAYSKEVFFQNAFLPIDHAEDRSFYEAAQAAGFPIHTRADRQGEVVHVIHTTNTSGEYPQYRIPLFLVEEQTAPFITYIREVYED